jgi:hypothetical protein
MWPDRQKPNRAFGAWPPAQSQAPPHLIPPDRVRDDRVDHVLTRCQRALRPCVLQTQRHRAAAMPTELHRRDALHGSPTRRLTCAAALSLGHVLPFPASRTRGYGHTAAIPVPLGPVCAVTANPGRIVRRTAYEEEPNSSGGTLSRPAATRPRPVVSAQAPRAGRPGCHACPRNRSRWTHPRRRQRAKEPSPVAWPAPPAGTRKHRARTVPAQGGWQSRAARKAHGAPLGRTSLAVMAG